MAAVVYCRVSPVWWVSSPKTATSIEFNETVLQDIGRVVRGGIITSLIGSLPRFFDSIISGDILRCVGLKTKVR